MQQGIAEIHAVQAALTDGAIRPVFQPIVSVTGDRWGFEALSRFPNDLAPDRVWASAQQQGLAVALDRVAMRAAITAGEALGGLLFLNVTSAHFREAEALGALSAPARVIWEVTESTALSEADVRGIEQLKRQGYRIAMDDAGAGHSTIERLYVVQPDIVKIDRPIVQVWAAGKPEPLRYWIACAHEMGAWVIAEGVEDIRWVRGLAAEGVAAVQGYAVGKPAAVEQWTLHEESEYSRGDIYHIC